MKVGQSQAATESQPLVVLLGWSHAGLISVSLVERRICDTAERTLMGSRKLTHDGAEIYSRKAECRHWPLVANT